MGQLAAEEVGRPGMAEGEPLDAHDGVEILAAHPANFKARGHLGMWRRFAHRSSAAEIFQQPDLGAAAELGHHLADRFLKMLLEHPRLYRLLHLLEAQVAEAILVVLVVTARLGVAEERLSDAPLE